MKNAVFLKKWEISADFINNSGAWIICWLRLL